MSKGCFEFILSLFLCRMEKAEKCGLNLIYHKVRKFYPSNQLIILLS
jgi:hypothetical protein